MNRKWAFTMSSVESQKGAINVQRCSAENQKASITVNVYSDSALLVFNGTSLNSDNALLALYWRCKRLIHQVRGQVWTDNDGGGGGQPLFASNSLPSLSLVHSKRGATPVNNHFNRENLIGILIL